MDDFELNRMEPRRSRNLSAMLRAKTAPPLSPVKSSWLWRERNRLSYCW